MLVTPHKRCSTHQLGTVGHCVKSCQSGASVEGQEAASADGLAIFVSLNIRHVNNK